MCALLNVGKDGKFIFWVRHSKGMPEESYGGKREPNIGQEKEDVWSNSVAYALSPCKILARGEPKSCGKKS